MRRAARRDANEGEVLAAINHLLMLGIVVGVEQISAPGLPDLLVGVWRFEKSDDGPGVAWLLVEVKHRKGVLQPAQVAFFQRNRGPAVVVDSGAAARSAVLAFRLCESLAQWSWEKWAPKGVATPNRRKS